MEIFKNHSDNYGLLLNIFLAIQIKLWRSKMAKCEEDEDMDEDEDEEESDSEDEDW